MDSPRAPRWSLRLPDLTGRRAMVTGASDGVGVEIARGLAAAGAEVVLPVRNRAKGERAAERILETVPDAAQEPSEADQVLQCVGCQRWPDDSPTAQRRQRDVLTLPLAVQGHRRGV